MKIFITGFMGSGKTHWAKIWAQQSSLTFYDLDALIEAEEGMTIEKLFDKKGEPYFRERETAMLYSLAKKDNFILSCGGGTPCFNNNIQWMNENGITVYLHCLPKTILQNVLAEKQQRPLIKNINESELLFFIEKKLKERESFYSQAKLTLKTEELDNNTITTILNYTNA